MNWTENVDICACFLQPYPICMPRQWLTNALAVMFLPASNAEKIKVESNVAADYHCCCQHFKKLWLNPATTCRLWIWTSPCRKVHIVTPHCLLSWAQCFPGSKSDYRIYWINTPTHSHKWITSYICTGHCIMGIFNRVKLPNGSNCLVCLWMSFIILVKSCQQLFQQHIEA